MKNVIFVSVITAIIASAKISAQVVREQSFNASQFPSMRQSKPMKTVTSKNDQVAPGNEQQQTDSAGLANAYAVSFPARDEQGRLIQKK